MCMGGGGQQAPYVPPVQTKQATRPDEANADVESAKANARKKALAAKGSEENNLTGGLGATGTATTKKKTLLGGA